MANSVNSAEVIIPITQSFGDPGDSGLISGTIMTDSDGQGIRELYNNKKSSTTGMRLDFATNYLADLIIAGNGRRANTPQIAVILTDASSDQLSNAGSGGGSNWITEANRLRTAIPEGIRIILIITEEAASAYSDDDPNVRATVDAVVGDGQLLIVPTYSEAADATNGYVETVSQAVCNATIPTASDPKLLLVKRITAINPGQSDEVQFNGFVDDGTANNEDNDPNWPDDDDIYLRGEIVVDPNNTVAKPGDEIEYTIYFLSNGDETARNVQVCDVIPDNMTFVANSYGSNFGVTLLNSSATGATPTNLSNAADTDGATFFASGATLPKIDNPPPNSSENLCRKVDTKGTVDKSDDDVVEVDATNNDNGAVVVEIDTLPEATAPGTPVNSYGFIRFRARVK